MEPASRRSSVLLRVALLVLLTVPWGAARAQSSRLRIAGTNASNEVKLRTTSADLRHALRVDLLSASGTDGGVEDVLPGGVTVLVDPLQSQDGVQVPLTATVGGAPDGGATADLSARQPLHVEVSGKLPAVGDYTGQVVLIHAGGRETTALTVTRVQAAPTVQFVAQSPAVATSGWGWRTVDATVRLPFKETAGVAGKMDAPRLLQLQRKAPDLGTSLVQPRFEGADFAVEGLLPDGGVQDLASLPEGIPVAAHGSGALVLTLRELEGPGEYTGTVRVAVPAGVPVEQPFTVWVRSPWTWGALLIALGALSSYAVRLYTQRIRPRAQRLQRAQALSRRLKSLMVGQDKAAQDVGLAVSAQVDSLVSEIRKPVRGIGVGDAELAAMEPRLRLYEAWCDASRKLRALPEEVRPPQASKLLSDVEEALRGEDGNQLDAQLKAVRELDVVGLARAGLEARLQDMDKQARALAKQRGRDTLGFRLTYELLPLLQSVREGLDAMDLGTARQQFELARRSYFDILCAELSNAVASPHPPRGFTEEEWRELTTDVKERLRQARARADVSVDEAFRMYQGAHAIYVRRLIMELRGEVELARRDATTEAHQATLKGIDDTLGEAMGFLAAESPHEAAVAYDEARAALARYQQPFRAITGVILEPLAGHDGGESVPLPGAATPGAPTGGSIPSLPEAPAAGLPSLGDFEGIPLPSPRHMWLVEMGVLLLLTGVAVALGLQLLNVFSPTWGGFGAGMTAFLWGFGLHQVGNATFEGLGGLLTRVEKQGTPPAS